MKQLLLLLIAAIALPTTIKPESVYLVVNTANGSMVRENGQLMVGSMKSLAGCEEAGLKIISRKRFKKGKVVRDISFECASNTPGQLILKIKK